MRRLRVGIDCDGPLSDFRGAAFDFLGEHIGERPDGEDQATYEIFSTYGTPELKGFFYNDVAQQKGFCRDLRVMPGSQLGVKHIQEIADVVIVTSPFHAPHWAHERAEWLMGHFDIPRKNIIQTPAKSWVHCDVLLDDMLQHLLDWWDERKLLEHFKRPKDHAILWDMPYNRVDAAKPFSRVKNWDHAYAIVRDLADKTLERRKV